MAATAVDRAAAVRRALRVLVAERGFHGASMSAVAAEAGVATGTAYTHYASKDELVIAAYLETKAELGAAATAGIEEEREITGMFRRLWLNAYRHLAEHRDRALFLLQVDASPYRAKGHAIAMESEDDPLLAVAGVPEVAELLLPLPLEVIYELGLAPAVRLAASGEALSDDDLTTVADACWRAISLPLGR